MVFVRPDGFAGGLMAAEGFSDARTILHGPGGCRFRYMRLSQELYSRPGDDPTDFDRDFFFGNPRLPCTFLDEKDYVYGGYSKIEAALKEVSSTGCSLIVVINSPATALIGDNVRKAISEAGLEGRAMTIDFNPVSTSMSEGFDRVSTEIVRFIAPRSSKKIPHTVNLLGVPILCRDWNGTVSEIRRLLSLMGLDVLSAIGAGSSVEDVRASAQAEYNICVYPEYCAGLARLYEEEFGAPSVMPRYAPIGFDATEEWIRSVSEATGADPSSALADVAASRQRAKDVLFSDGRRASRLAGTHFSISGDYSVVRPLLSWLFEYLSMIPVSVEGSFDEVQRADIEGYLASAGIPDCIGTQIDHCGYRFGPGDNSEIMRLAGRSEHMVDIGFPPRREFLFNNSTIVGTVGSMNLLDRIFNT